uniref:Uncharacterized protein n=1 Tax=Zymomonas mobilis subsp. mobilis str. CP4 = NRRL B-14023 TaxID=627343 RepID=B3GN65_ZYMMB|nr:hypothetical protein [Zymomonas mobilis subsp. mobilis str. CP4 = NRRL B-14023]
MPTGHAYRPCLPAMPTGHPTGHAYLFQRMHKHKSVIVFYSITQMSICSFELCNIWLN